MDRRFLALLLAAVLVFSSVTMSIMLFTGQNEEKEPAAGRREKVMENSEKTDETGEKGEDEVKEDLNDPSAQTEPVETQKPDDPDEPTDPDDPSKTQKTPGPGAEIAVKESKAVDDDYFKDALFIGDSRVEGFRLQSGVKNATFYTYKGLNVTQVQKTKFIKSGSNKLTVFEALEKNKFKKVYIKLGVNELGWGSYPTFIKRYKELIEKVKKTQGDGVVIYVMEVIQVSKKKNDGNDIFTKDNVNKMNGMLVDMVKEEEVNYLQLNEFLTDDDGFLFADASTDGIHLGPTYCKKWLEYLKTHTV